MTHRAIEKAQRCLVMDGFKILDIEPLLRNHKKEAVIWFLEILAKEKRDLMKKWILEDSTSSELDCAIVVWFRINMAIQAIKEDKEVK